MRSIPLGLASQGHSINTDNKSNMDSIFTRKQQSYGGSQFSKDQNVKDADAMSSGGNSNNSHGSEFLKKINFNLQKEEEKNNNYNLPQFPNQFDASD